MRAMTDRRYPRWRRWGATLALATGTALVVSAPGLPGSAAPLPPTSLWAQTEILSGADGARGDYFGDTATMSADGRTVAVGVPWYSSGHARRGAVYLYERPAGNWADTSVFGARLTALDAADDDMLGRAVALSADGSILVAGAPQQANGGTRRGAVYVYTRPGGGWQTSDWFSARLTLDDAADGDLFGDTVAVSADGGTIVACTARIMSLLRPAFCAVFQADASGWRSSATPIARLSLSDDLGGPSNLVVAISADSATIVVGGLSSAQPSNTGALYVFAKPPGGWRTSTETARLTVAAGAPASLGRNVAVSADGSTIVGGATDISSTDAVRGAGYLYTRPPAGWATTSSPSALFTLATPGSSDQLGSAVAVSADGRIVGVGASSRAGRGAVALYERPVGGWLGALTEQAMLTVDAPSPYTRRLGATVALSADGGTVLAGEPEGTSGGGSGSAFIYLRPPSGWANASSAAELRPSRWVGEGVLTSLATSADGGTIAVGHALSSSSMSFGGSVALYEKDSAGWRHAHQAALITTAGGNFLTAGAAVALSANGDTLVVGSERNLSLGLVRGGVSVYRRPSAGWADMPPTARLTTTDQGDWDGFGTVLAISADGHTIVASAPWHDSGGGALGIIYVYREPPTGWADMSETARLSLTPRSAMTTLGRAVAISGDGQTIVASAPDAVVGSALQSSTFVFVQPQLGWATTTAATAELRTTPDAPADGNTTVAIDQTGSIIAVGCRGGRTLIFQRPGFLWAGADPIAILSRSDPPPPPYNNESFMSIGISSDGGFIVMGIPLAQLLLADSGTAYVYSKPAAGWATTTESLRLTTPGMARFGSVATIGGERRMIVIGTPTADYGAAFVFERPAVQIFAPLAAYERLIR